MIDCEFCRADAAVAFDDGHFIVRVASYQPTGPGYALVAPKAHTPNLSDLDSNARARLIELITKVSIAIGVAFATGSTTIMINVGRPAQRVPHLHAHVVPRRIDDGYPTAPSVRIDDADVARQAVTLGDVLRTTA